MHSRAVGLLRLVPMRRSIISYLHMFSFLHDPSPAPRIRSLRSHSGPSAGHPFPYGERGASVGLVLLALALALLQHYQGLSTDEAKYLLDIPYPHPPLLRWLMGMTSLMPGQVFLWRTALAFALLSGAWIAASLLPETQREYRPMIGALWILSASVLTLSGQILMAPVTALQALIFFRLLLKDEGYEAYAGWIALLWLASLFTAYQALLFLPIAAAVFWRMRLPAWKRLVCTGGPVLLLVLYSLGNPLAVASMITASEQNADAGSLPDAVRGLVGLWILGGSGVVSILGVIGMATSRRWPLILSFFLTALFIMVSFRPYYCILLTPLLFAGIASAPSLLKRGSLIVVLAAVFALVLVPASFRPITPPVAAQVRAQAIAAGIPKGATMMIAGSFGHEWQYASPYHIRRFVPAKLGDARVLVCLTECPGVSEKDGWTRLVGVTAVAWVRPMERD